MKKLLLILGISATIFSCEKEEPAPSYTPGRLTKIWPTSNPLDYNTTFSYESNKITRVDYSFEDGDSAIYSFDSDRLIQVVFNNNENKASKFYSEDTIRYEYKVDRIYEYITYIDGAKDTGFYHLNSGVIDYAIINKNRYSIDNQRKYDSCIYTWSNNNLIKYEVFEIINGVISRSYSHSYEYSDITNPFYMNNIPRIEEHSKNDPGSKRIWQLVPNCSPLLPFAITYNSDDSWFLKNWYDSKTFGDNLPYEMRLLSGTDKDKASYADYSFEYEKK